MTASDKKMADVQVLCNRQINALMEANRAITGALVSSIDGFDIACHLPPLLSPSKISAMTSSQVAISDAICSDAKISTCQNIVIEADGGRIVMMNIPFSQLQLLLTVFCNSNELLGRLLWSVHACVREITIQLDEIYAV